MSAKNKMRTRQTDTHTEGLGKERRKWEQTKRRREIIRHSWIDDETDKYT